MNCDQYNEYLDEYLDGELDGPLLGKFELHAKSCSDCSAALARKTRLRQALKQIPLTSPEPDFFSGAIEHVVKTTRRNERLYWSTAGIGSAIAATAIVWLALGLPTDHQEGFDEQLLAGVTISMNVEKTVRVKFESSRELQGATLIVRLPPGVEIAGYENRSEISWTTTVRRGTNILKLPIIVRSGLGGTVLAMVQHAGKEKSFRFSVTVI